MQRVQLGALLALALGPDTGPAVLLCHGFGAPGDDLVPLAEALDPDLRWRWFFPQGPIDLRSQGIPGRAWWHIDIMRMQMAVMSGRAEELVRETPEGLAEARAALEGAISALETEHGVKREALVVGGFSQGAMLTTEVALHASPPFAGLAVISGALVSQLRWAEAARAQGARLPVFQSHGRADPILPFAGAELLRELLRSSGAKVDFVEHRGGHEIPMEALRGLREFLRVRLGGGPA